MIKYKLGENKNNKKIVNKKEENQNIIIKKLQEKITKAENGELVLTDLELEVLKKEKLKLKDEAYAAILKYKKEHNL